MTTWAAGTGGAMLIVWSAANLVADQVTERRVSPLSEEERQGVEVNAGGSSGASQRGPSDSTSTISVTDVIASATSIAPTVTGTTLSPVASTATTTAPRPPVRITTTTTSGAVPTTTTTLAPPRLLSTTTTTTAPDKPSSQTFVMVGGAARVSCHSDNPLLVWATPHVGFTAGTSETDETLEVEFQSDDHISRLTARCAGGALGEITEISR